MKKFKFIYVQHKDMSNIKGWYLVVEPTLESLVTEVDKLISNNAVRCVQHPNENKFSLNCLHPVTRACQYSDALLKQHREGETIWVNPNGGWMPQSDAYIILETQHLDKMVFPTLPPKKDTVPPPLLTGNPTDQDSAIRISQPDETISITQFKPNGHYYLKSSDPTRSFSSFKFDTYDEAKQEALQYTTNIVSQFHSLSYHQHEGD